MAARPFVYKKKMAFKYYNNLIIIVLYLYVYIKSFNFFFFYSSKHKFVLKLNAPCVK